MPQPIAVPPSLISRFGAAATAAGLTTPALAPQPDAAPATPVRAS